jgi:hypothetical protein
MIKRYGTSSMPCDSGIYVLYSEYERVVAECADWKRRWQDAVDHASEAITERNHWQANHDHQVARARFLIERGDIPVERVRAYEEMEALREDAERYRKLGELVAFGGWFVGTDDEKGPRDRLGPTQQRYLDDKADMDKEMDAARDKEKT